MMENYIKSKRTREKMDWEGAEKQFFYVQRKQLS